MILFILWLRWRYGVRAKLTVPPLGVGEFRVAGTNAARTRVFEVSSTDALSALRATVKIAKVVGAEQ